jgi:hypothetical protein
MYRLFLYKRGAKVIKRTGILEVSDQWLLYKNLLEKGLMGKIKNYRGDNLQIKAKYFKDIKVDLKNRSLFFIIHGEEIYVKYMILPKVKKEKLYSLIKNELEYRFKKIDNIMFNYEIFKDNGMNLEVIVFCLNWSKADLLEECVKNGGEIKGIYPVQFHVFNNYRKRIKEKDYIFIFFMEENLYFLGCRDNKIIGNSLCKIYHRQKFIQELERFKIKCCAMNNFEGFSSIFFVGFPDKKLIEYLSKEYHCTDLGDIDKENLERF